MKTTAQAATGSKADIMKNVRSAKRKVTTAAKRGSRTASKLTNGSRKTAEGYSEQGLRLIKRGKAAFLDASTWAGDKASGFPKAARSLNLPDQKAVQSLMHEKPLFVGAVGLGVGVVIGALLPSIGSKAKPARRK
jgi:hypothetical protein